MRVFKALRLTERVEFEIILEELNNKYKIRPKALSLFNKNYDYSISSYSKNIKIFEWQGSRCCGRVRLLR